MVGGFIAPQAQLHRVPLLALYGDGRLIVPGPQIELYPGPALPNLQVRAVSEAGIQAILAAARAAGLLGPDRQYDGHMPDVPTTTFTVVADGARHVVSVQGLGAGGPATGSGSEDSAAVARLVTFQLKVTDLGLSPDEVGAGGARQEVIDVAAAEERKAGEIVVDEGDAYERIIAFLEQLKVL